MQRCKGASSSLPLTPSDPPTAFQSAKARLFPFAAAGLRFKQMDGNVVRDKTAFALFADIFLAKKMRRVRCSTLMGQGREGASFWRAGQRQEPSLQKKIDPVEGTSNLALVLRMSLPDQRDQRNFLPEEEHLGGRLKFGSGRSFHLVGCVGAG